MGSPSVVDIWPFDTGISDLPADWSNLAIPEVARIREDWAALRRELEAAGRLTTFIQQLHREWAIETGIIENLYDIERGVTQSLIELGFSSEILEHGSTNKPKDYVLALLEDQREALEGLFSFIKQDRELTTGYIRELHSAITRSQTTAEALDPNGNRIDVPLLHGEWKTHPNYPRRNGTVFRYCPPEHVAAEMDRLVSLHKAQSAPPEVKATWLHHRFTQIHPFQDGNGRVARTLASLVLIQAGLFPMNVPRDEKAIYLEALEMADAGDLRSLVLMTARQQEKSYLKGIAFR